MPHLNVETSLLEIHSDKLMHVDQSSFHVAQMLQLISRLTLIGLIHFNELNNYY